MRRLLALLLLLSPTPAWADATPEGMQPAGKIVPHSCLSYYPTSEKEAGIEGTTRLQMTVTEDGDVRDLVVATSSGNTNLDNAALRCASRWRYNAATQNGKPVAATWFADVVWKLEAPQLPPFAEPARDCVHYYPVKPEDLMHGDGKSDVTFKIVGSEVSDARITHSSGNATLDRDAIDCITSRKYVRETELFNGKPVDRYSSLTVREQIDWADALKPAPSPTTPSNSLH